MNSFRRIKFRRFEPGSRGFRFFGITLCRHLSFCNSLFAILNSESTLYHMAEDAVVVATGGDRPGVMDELSQFLMECGVNIIQSRSVNLAGTYSLLLLVRGEAAAIQS